LRHLFHRMMLLAALTGVPAASVAQNTTLTQELSNRGIKPLTPANIDAAGGDPTARALAAKPTPKVSRAATLAVTSNPYDLPELGGVTTTPTGSQVQVTFPTTCGGTGFRAYVAAASTVPYIGTGAASDWANFYANPVPYGGTGNHVQFQTGTVPNGTTVAQGANIYRTISGTATIQPQRSTVDAFEVNTDAAKIGRGGGSLYFRLLVGGSPQTLQYVTKATPDPVASLTTLPAAGYIQLTFPNAAIRTVRFEAELDLYFDGVWVPTNYSVWRTDPAQLVRCGILGDSYATTVPPINTGTTAGGNVVSTPTVAWNGPVVQAARMLGCNDIRNAGIAGTGFMNPGSTWTFGSHVSDVTSVQPDVYINTGAFNDNSTYTNAQITAAVSAVLAAQRAASPNATIIQYGSWAGNTGPSAAVIQSEIAVAAAVTAANDNNICFIPISNIPTTAGITGSNAILYGTGSDIAPNGTGNNDLYLNGNQSPPTHPNFAGSNFEARRLITAMRACVASR
jgi:hypothetical protein